jgi:hypothetical protein
MYFIIEFDDFIMNEFRSLLYQTHLENLDEIIDYMLDQICSSLNVDNDTLSFDFMECFLYNRPEYYYHNTDLIQVHYENILEEIRKLLTLHGAYPNGILKLKEFVRPTAFLYFTKEAPTLFERPAPRLHYSTT